MGRGDAVMLEIQGLSAGYAGEDVLVDLDLRIRSGERIAVLGPSGIGKTTLLRCIKGLHPFRGRITLGGSDIRREDPAVALVYQDLRLLPWMTAAENIELPLKIAGTPPKERRRLRTEQLAQVGLPGYGDRYPRELSGGEQQRVALARTMITRPELLLLDEPFSSLDAMKREALQELLIKRTLREGLSFLLVTHSIAEAVFLAERIIFIHPGKVPREFSTASRAVPSSREERSFVEDELKVRVALEEYYGT